jgi:NAD(P)-dependent dehydrogenase (short-subunit alcohol dehydrogenase family)
MNGAVPLSFRLDGRRAVVTGRDADPCARAVIAALDNAGAERSFIDIAGMDGETLAARIGTERRFDIFVNLAARDEGVAICDDDAGLLDAMLGHIECAFLASQAAARIMLADRGARGHRAIVHVASPLARVGAAERSACTMAMHALRGLVAASALELAPQGIGVNLIEANLNDAHERAAPRPAGPADVAAAIVYLASAAGAAMAGASLLLDAGWTAR